MTLPSVWNFSGSKDGLPRRSPLHDVRPPATGSPLRPIGSDCHGSARPRRSRSDTRPDAEPLRGRAAVEPGHASRVRAALARSVLSVGARIRRRHTKVALSVVRAHRGSKGSNPSPSSSGSDLGCGSGGTLRICSGSITAARPSQAGSSVAGRS